MSTHDDYRPYTYVTASIHEGNTRLGVSFHTAELSVIAMNVHGIRPYLCIGSAEGQLSISTTGGGPVTSADLDLAREIADAAARYRDECERLHTGQAVVPAPSPNRDDDPA
ncbi:hypothetical protein [Streptosporangium carneum]|uniref:Uncharacterized protein n=1 Tax=Streptosporangium carneum TaxID=47481 RepID=A0A9W6HW36_9ACTN|nr:hypothetical protein [Streptosporangium carneum]GLK07396.1 hypothetical protein GCM10017600_08010 [Streptosporangium carneum]